MPMIVDDCSWNNSLGIWCTSYLFRFLKNMCNVFYLRNLWSRTAIQGILPHAGWAAVQKPLPHTNGAATQKSPPHTGWAAFRRFMGWHSILRGSYKSLLGLCGTEGLRRRCVPALLRFLLSFPILLPRWGRRFLRPSACRGSSCRKIPYLCLLPPVFLLLQMFWTCRAPILWRIWSRACCCRSRPWCSLSRSSNACPWLLPTGLFTPVQKNA